MGLRAPGTVAHAVRKVRVDEHRQAPDGYFNF
jgi:hypothetical protein